VLLGTDTDGSDGWSWTGSTKDKTLWPGFNTKDHEYTYFAQAEDYDGLLSNVASATGNVIENYAVLFSGGHTPNENKVWYYDCLKETYDTLVNKCSLDRANIHVLYADGTDPGIDRADHQNSPMGFAAGSDIRQATSQELGEVIALLRDRVTDSDHILFWFCDHGGDTAGNDPTNTTGEMIAGWHETINDEALAPLLQQVEAGCTTYFFFSCFAGGMLDDLMPVSCQGSLKIDRRGSAQDRPL
jgi:hypothetical protein